MKALLLFLVLVAGAAQAAVTCTSASLTHTNQSGTVRHGKRWTCAWTSSAGGAASGDFTPSGWLSRIFTVPGTGGNQPTNGYGITLTCSLTASTDALAGILANRSNTNTEWFPVAHSGISVVTYLNDTCTWNVSGAGNAKSGTIYIDVLNP